MRKRENYSAEMLKIVINHIYSSLIYEGLGDFKVKNR